MQEVIRFFSYIATTVSATVVAIFVVSPHMG